jgi:hypothetical protein
VNQGFRINYASSRAPVPKPTRYEGYDLESAFYDYMPKGLGATIEIDGYSLRLSDNKFVEFVRSCLPLAEQLQELPPETAKQLRKYFPALPAEFKIYSWLFADFMQWLPIIVFATDGKMTWLYTRTLDESKGHPLVVLPGRDRVEPVKVPRSAVLKEIRSFLTRYLEDLSSALPFIRSDAIYKNYQARILALEKTG